MLKVHNDNNILFIHLEQRDKDIDETWHLVGEQDKAIKFLEREINKAGDVIRGQEIILEKLIQHLKNIGEWPPKIDPPNRPNRSDA